MDTVLSLSSRILGGPCSGISSHRRGEARQQQLQAPLSSPPPEAAAADEVQVACLRLCEFLAAAGLRGDLAPRFVEEGWTEVSFLVGMTEKDMITVGLCSDDDRKTFRSALEKLQAHDASEKSKAAPAVGSGAEREDQTSSGANDLVVLLSKLPQDNADAGAGDGSRGRRSILRHHIGAAPRVAVQSLTGHDLIMESRNHDSMIQRSMRKLQEECDMDRVSHTKLLRQQNEELKQKVDAALRAGKCYISTDVLRSAEKLRGMGYSKSDAGATRCNKDWETGSTITFLSDIAMGGAFRCFNPCTKFKDEKMGEITAAELSKRGNVLCGPNGPVEVLEARKVTRTEHLMVIVKLVGVTVPLQVTACHRLRCKDLAGNPITCTAADCVLDQLHSRACELHTGEEYRLVEGLTVTKSSDEVVQVKLKEDQEIFAYLPTSRNSKSERVSVAVKGKDHPPDATDIEARLGGMHNAAWQARQLGIAEDLFERNADLPAKLCDPRAVQAKAAADIHAAIQVLQGRRRGAKAQEVLSKERRDMMQDALDVGSAKLQAVQEETDWTIVDEPEDQPLAEDKPPRQRGERLSRGHRQGRKALRRAPGNVQEDQEGEEERTP